MNVHIAASAEVHPTATIGEGTAVWGLAQVREHSRVGRRCVVGRAAYIDAGVTVGDDCKIQNGALLYQPAVIEDGVFIGPAVCFTNDRYPRAVSPEGTRKSSADWTSVGVTCRAGSSIGAGALCVAPVTIGRWALVAAGAVVVADVDDFALVAGNPARRVAWVGKAGAPLRRDEEVGTWRCPTTAATYREADGRLWEDSS